MLQSSAFNANVTKGKCVCVERGEETSLEFKSVTKELNSQKTGCQMAVALNSFQCFLGFSVVAI